MEEGIFENYYQTLFKFFYFIITILIINKLDNHYNLFLLKYKMYFHPINNSINILLLFFQPNLDLI